MGGGRTAASHAGAISTLLSREVSATSALDELSTGVRFVHLTGRRSALEPRRPRFRLVPYQKRLSKSSLAAATFVRCEPTGPSAAGEATPRHQPVSSHRSPTERDLRAESILPERPCAGARPACNLRDSLRRARSSFKSLLAFVGLAEFFPTSPSSVGTTWQAFRPSPPARSSKWSWETRTPVVCTKTGASCAGRKSNTHQRTLRSYSTK